MFSRKIAISTMFSGENFLENVSLVAFVEVLEILSKPY